MKPEKVLKKNGWVEVNSQFGIRFEKGRAKLMIVRGSAWCQHTPLSRRELKAVYKLCRR